MWVTFYRIRCRRDANGQFHPVLFFERKPAQGGQSIRFSRLDWRPAGKSWAFEKIVGLRLEASHLIGPSAPANKNTSGAFQLIATSLLA
jgi:hypothetical protein